MDRSTQDTSPSQSLLSQDSQENKQNMSAISPPSENDAQKDFIQTTPFQVSDEFSMEGLENCNLPDFQPMIIIKKEENRTPEEVNEELIYKKRLIETLKKEVTELEVKQEPEDQSSLNSGYLGVNNVVTQLGSVEDPITIESDDDEYLSTIADVIDPASVIVENAMMEHSNKEPYPVQRNWWDNTNRFETDLTDVGGSFYTVPPEDNFENGDPKDDSTENPNKHSKHIIAISHVEDFVDETVFDATNSNLGFKVTNDPLMTPPRDIASPAVSPSTPVKPASKHLISSSSDEEISTNSSLIALLRPRFTKRQRTVISKTPTENSPYFHSHIILESPANLNQHSKNTILNPSKGKKRVTFGSTPSFDIVVTKTTKTIIRVDASSSSTNQDKLHEHPSDAIQEITEVNHGDVADSSFNPAASQTTSVPNHNTTLATNVQVESDALPDANLPQNQQQQRPQDPLSGYQFNSPSMYLHELRALMSSHGFSRVNPGLRGLVSVLLVPNIDFERLKIWEIPGALYDFGHSHSISEVSRKMTDMRIAQGLQIPAEYYTIRDLNRFISENFNKTPCGYTTNGTEFKVSFELGQDLYEHYQWVDPTMRALGPNELFDMVMDSNASFMSEQLAPWPCTLFPRDPSDMKYNSVVTEHGREYVCRTAAQRQRMISFLTENSEIFSCVICKCIISTEYHTFVYCYEYKKNQRFQIVNAWRNTFLRACYIHFRISNTKLEGRNCYQDAAATFTRNQTRGGRGRGSFGGASRPYARRGRAAATLF